jgi:arabinogalactan oligomer / maltooligosaccharide transport system permease protein
MKRFAVAIVIKYILVAFAISVLLFFAQSAFASAEYEIAAFLALSIFAIAITYLTKISIPLKFFLPGLLFLAAFAIGPILYTLVMSGFQYQTGNYISKEQAIERVTALGVEADEAGTTFDVRVGRIDNGEIALLASDPFVTNQYFLTTESARFPLEASALELDGDGLAITAPGFTEFENRELRAIEQEVLQTRFKYQDEFFLKLEGSDIAAVKRQKLAFDSANDQFRDLITGDIYRDNGRGNYADVNDPERVLQPGWRSPIWFSHYIDLFTDDKVRAPLIKVFLWTVIFASVTVATQFALGLLVAIAMNKAIIGRRIYRSIFILPYAMPSIMSILIWGGMFETEFGAINNLLGTDVAWFQNANFARAAVIIVNLWLGFPYFYLVSSGALQAIPSELSEAAAIDGANARKIFSKITLPLLLQILAPLLVASFAFNFNNFNLIFLLTGGGPRNDLDGEIAGATDILISYTYRIAFGTNVQNLGLASAISVIIFIIVAAISLYGIRKSKVLESFK